MQQPASNFQQKLTQKIAKWKAGLADLGRRNPLIVYNLGQTKLRNNLKIAKIGIKN